MKNKLSDVLLGLFLILVAVLIAGNVIFDWNLTLFFPGWWTLLIIIPAIVNIIKSGFGIFNTLCVVIGAMLLGVQLFPEQLSWDLFGKLIFPAVLLVIGLNLLFNGSFKKVPAHVQKGNGRGTDYSAVFGAVEQRIIGEFNGADITSIFGGVDLDLREAIITKDIVINATVIFGGADIFLPSNVRVKLSTVPIFGGASNKAERTSDSDAPTVYISSVCIFGGVEAK